MPLKFGNNFYNISDFITDDNKSAEFIRNILKDDTFVHPDEKSPLYDVAKARSRHSALTFLIGLVFKEFGGLYDSFKATTKFGGEYINLKIWMMTALSHDKGYYSERLQSGIPAHKQAFYYTLLTDNYPDKWQELVKYSKDIKNVPAYEYDDIITYDIASVDWRKGQIGGEKVDHGILGGCIVFNEYLNKLQKTTATVIEKELYSIKTCALTIAQHNMFKSDTIEQDKRFPNKPRVLQSSSNFRISSSTPLLLFLSLIDTFECVKKFGKENNNKNVTALTVLKNIYISAHKNMIVIDYSKLFSHIHEKMIVH